MSTHARATVFGIAIGAILLSVWPSAAVAQDLLPLPTGACCASNGTCSVVIGITCVFPSEYQGNNTNCVGLVCNGACCQADGSDDGLCTLTGTASSCGLVGGQYHGHGSLCTGRDCAGACCRADGSCDETLPAGCAAPDVFQALPVTCANVDCDGACCLPSGECDVLGQGGCTDAGGIFNGFASTCNAATITACRGACCYGKKECQEIGQTGCADLRGDFQGGGTGCETDCPSPMPTAFTYQGQLKEDGAPIDRPVSLYFTLWANEIDGAQVGATICATPLGPGGLFTVPLDFGVAVFNTNARWLQIEICDGGCVALGASPAAGSCQTLRPRQLLTPTPYALQTRGIVVAPNQNVGIGTKTPAHKLHVVGNVHIDGTLSKDAGAFRIDHPLDPEHKYLSHSFVESPDMMNVYNGNVVLDSNGEAVVLLPAYFEALNSDFRYQLSALGAPGPDLYVAQEVCQNRFKIAGGQPGQTVSWQVTGIRQDAYAKQYRIQVEEEKSAADRAARN